MDNIRTTAKQILQRLRLNSLLGRLVLLLTFFFILENLLLIWIGVGILHKDYSAAQQFHHFNSAQVLATRMQQALDAQVSFDEVERIAYEFHQLQPRVRQLLVSEEGQVLHVFFGKNQGDEKYVDPKPIEAFVRGAQLPLYLQDPSGKGRGAVTFSAAKVTPATSQSVYLVLLFPSQPLETLSARSMHTLLTSGSGSVLFLIIVGAIILSVFLANTITTPIRLLRNSAAAIAGGTFSSRAAVQGADEVRELAEYFNAMASEIEAKIAQLHQEDKLRRELVGGLSHDLSAPASIIVTCAEFLLDPDSEFAVQKRDDYIESMVRNAQSIQLLTEDLLQLAKLGSTTIKLAYSEIYASELLSDIYAAFKPIADAKQVALTLEIEDTNTLVRGDQVLLTRVVNNLLGNAIRHSTSGGTVTLRAETIAGQVVIQIEDDGQGINEEDIAKIFQPYYQGSGGNKGIMGLGLSICQRILEAHGSRLQVSSVIGRGATFSFGLPLLEDDDGGLA